jgi:nucleoside-diphosphate-sugar epimerase
MKRVLVTGASGFIGRHSLSRLVEAGYEVHAVFRRRAEHGPGRDVRWYNADLLREDAANALLEQVRPTHLLHFAWYAVPGKYWTAPENLDWVKATANLMQGFERIGGERAVMAGSCAEYDWKFDYCSEALTPCRPATFYGACKHAAHVLLDAWSQRSGISSAWGRIFYLYGPGEPPSRLVPSVIGSLLRDEPAQCTHGGQVRDFMYVEDVAAAFVALLDSRVQGAVNIASGSAVAIKDVVNAIADFLDKHDLVRLGAIPVPAGEPDALIADTERLRNEVGFSPSCDLPQGIARTVEHIRTTSSR